MSHDVLVSIGLPVRDGADRIERAVRSVLGQDHARLELIICDNASTDDTEEICRALAAEDERISYHRQSVNVGLLPNFVQAMRVATGEFFRWIGDDDWLAPNFVSRAVEPLVEDESLVMTTTELAYRMPGGVVSTWPYTGSALRSSDPAERFIEVLRLLNHDHLVVDPLYGLMRREAVVGIARRNMLHEDEIYAAKLALAGPWAHVPEVLAGRSWTPASRASIARKLGVPAWQAHLATTLQCQEILRSLAASELTPDQRRRARKAVADLYFRRQGRTVRHRTRKLTRLATGRVALGR